MKVQGAVLDTIECPKCGHSIPVSEALLRQIEERARAQTRAEIAKLRASLVGKELEIQQREVALLRSLISILDVHWTEGSPASCRAEGLPWAGALSSASPSSIAHLAR
jgi:hypothetical protein